VAPAKPALEGGKDKRMTESGSSTVVRSGDGAWRALSVPGVSIKVLRDDQATGESAALLRFEAGARFPAHNHPGGEAIFVLEGELRIGGERLRAGDYLYTPPNGKHAAASPAGCVILVALPKPVEILKD
jgi:quercetin dioxygenase-like cupin family protein